MKTWIRNHQLITFFFIAFVIMFGVLFGFVYFRPGQVMESWSLVWFFSVFSPTFSALIVSWVVGGWPEVRRILSGFTRWKVGFFWYFAAAFLFLAPLVICLVYIALGNPSPGLREGETALSMAGIVLFTLFSGPIAEELGWRGFALPRLQARFNALVSSLILGFIWTCWHIPLFFVPGASQVSIPFPIYLVLVMTVTIYLTWLYNNTGGSLHHRPGAFLLQPDRFPDRRPAPDARDGLLYHLRTLALPGRPGGDHLLQAETSLPQAGS